MSVYRNWIIAIRFDCRMTDECSNSFFFCFNSKTLAVLIAHTLWTSPFTIKCTNALDGYVTVRRHSSAPNHGTFHVFVEYENKQIRWIANDIYLWCANGDVMHRDVSSRSSSNQNYFTWYLLPDSLYCSHWVLAALVWTCFIIILSQFWPDETMLIVGAHATTVRQWLTIRANVYATRVEYHICRDPLRQTTICDKEETKHVSFSRSLFHRANTHANPLANSAFDLKPSLAGKTVAELAEILSARKHIPVESIGQNPVVCMHEAYGVLWEIHGNCTRCLLFVVVFLASGEYAMCVIVRFSVANKSLRKHRKNGTNKYLWSRETRAQGLLATELDVRQTMNVDLLNIHTTVHSNGKHLEHELECQSHAMPPLKFVSIWLELYCF